MVSKILMSFASFAAGIAGILLLINGETTNGILALILAAIYQEMERHD